MHCIAPFPPIFIPSPQPPPSPSKNRFCSCFYTLLLLSCHRLQAASDWYILSPQAPPGPPSMWYCRSAVSGGFQTIPFVLPSCPSSQVPHLCPPPPPPPPPPNAHTQYCLSHAVAQLSSFGCRKLWSQTRTQICWTSLMLLMAWPAPPLMSVPPQTYLRGGSQVARRRPPPLHPFLSCDAFMRRSMLHRCFASIGKATIRRAFSFWNAPLTTKVADQCCLRLCCHLGCSPRSKQGCLSAYITPTLADILVAIHGVQAIVPMGPYIQQCSLAARPSSGTAAPALSCRSWSPSHPRLSERLTKCKPRSSSSTLTQVWPTCFLSSPCGAMHCLVGLPTCAFLRSRLPLLPASLCPSEFLCRLCYLWALSLCVTLLERAAFVCLQLLCPGCSVGQHGTSPKHCLAPMPWVLTHVKRKLSGLSGKSYR